MIETYNPSQYLIRINKLKYRKASIPIIIVIISFVLNIYFDYIFFKYISLFGLILFIFVSLTFRIHKTIPPDTDNNIFLSPINGHVFAIDKQNKIIILKKSIFDAADVRFCSYNFTSEVNIISKNIYWFEKEPNILGRLIGIIPSSAKCKCKLPDNYRINVFHKQKVLAGETILALSENIIDD